MNDRENDTKKQTDGRQVQQELESQLRAFGDTMSDAFAHGFEGRGEDIGDRAYGVGRAAVDAANYGINEVAKAFRSRRNAHSGAPEQKEQGLNEEYRAPQAAGMPSWFRQMFGKAEMTPADEIRASAKKRHNAGVALLAVGITFAVIFGISAISCFGAAAMFAPSTLLGDAVATEGDAITQVFVAGGEAIGSFAMGAIRVSGWAFTAITALFGWMTAAGASRMRAGKKLNLYADMAEEFDYQKGLSLEMLADLTHQKKQKALKALRGYIHRGWLSAWLDEKDEKLYLTAEDYRAAQEARKAAEQAPRPEPQPEEAENTVPLNLEVARSFAQVLKKEKALMQDERAVEELDHMQKTTQAICDWLEAHPESLPKARRFAEYYIPTTLKLLHTYNDVQGQQGENAEAIRRDIAGILHTLNQAYDNLYDKLLSDVALDVSSEIAALQGMLANDGLTGEGML